MVIVKINFGEAERQAAAFRMTAGGKQLPFPVASPTWQKQTFSSPPRHVEFVNMLNMAEFS